MKKFKKITALAAAIMTAVINGTVSSADNTIVELFPETGTAEITVRPDEERHKISPYIYGINDVGDISGLSPTVIKQTGTSLSTYNWENNCSNPGESGFNSNDISLVDSYSSASWNTPALYTDILYNKSRHANIPVKLVTLPMMGYVAKDSMGIVSDDVFSRTTRWCETKYRKNETFLISPDTTDNEVYIDEYVSFLVNKYGTSSEGGINGYFLDRQPDLWSKNFSVLGLPEITPSELVSRSAELASSVKAIDSTAFIFGPSVSDLQGCINLGSSDSWNSISENKEYSWFIDYYLSEMRAAGEKAGYRLLDCLDIHYYTKAMTPLGVSVVSSNDEYSNAYRMQSVKTLYDPDYTENSPVVLMNKQFTPVIPTLQASIRINYPGTRLSFSEYDFGGGDNISGAIAQTDALGIFAKENVYMACLSPISSDYRFQKAAFSLYTDYDGKGHDFGDMMINADNNKDSMSSVYAASDTSAPSVLRIILTNKNIVNSKDFDIEIVSEEYDYSLDKVYFIDKESARISESDLNIRIIDNKLSFTADTTSVYMLVLNGTEKEELAEVSESVTDVSETDTEPVQSEAVSQTPASVNSSQVSQAHSEPQISESVNPADQTILDITEPHHSEQPSVTSSTTEVSEISSDTEISEISEDENKGVAVPIKIIISVLALTVGLGVVYILIFDKK